MSYSIFAIIGLVINLIINHNVLFGRKSDNRFPQQREYHMFLVSISVFYVIDILWGIFNDHRINTLLYADTVLYFIAMSASVLVWTRYVVKFLNEDRLFSGILKITGVSYFVFEIILIIINSYTPILFTYNEVGDYVPGIARVITLLIQIAIFFIISVFTFWKAIISKGSERRHHFTIGLFGVAMIILITIQISFPLLPMYAVGCLFGSCVLYSFIVEDQVAEYRTALVQSLFREKTQMEELGSAKTLAYIDPLTRVKNKNSYNEREKTLNVRIADKNAGKFAIGVFDLNDLKTINDTKGHAVGDAYLVEAAKMICDTFTHSPVFRIGGDEFAVILEERDFLDRVYLFSSFESMSEGNIKLGKAVVASGFSDFDPENDITCSAVFKRADALMYERKRYLKSLSNKQQ